MKYIISIALMSDSFKERVARFLETGGLPPEGVTMHGRWHTLDGGQVFILASANDPKGIYRWVSRWADLIDFEVCPVIEDEDAAGILQELKL